MEIAGGLEEVIEEIVHRVCAEDLVRDVRTQHHVGLILQD